MTNDKNRPLRPLRKLLPFVAPYRFHLALASFSLVAAAAATLALPVALRLLIDTGFSGNNSHEQINQYFIGLLILACFLGFTTAARYYWVTWIGERLVADLRSALYAHILKMSPVFFESNRTGNILSRLTTDTTLIQSVIGSSASVALRNLLMLVGGLAMLLITSATLTGYILLAIPVVLLPIIIFGRRVKTFSKRSQDKVADSSAMAQEILNAMPTVQAYTAEPLEQQRFTESVETSFRTALQRIRNRAALTLLVILLVFSSVVLVLWLGAQAVVSGDMSAGELGQFLLYAVFTAGAMGVLSESWGEIQRAAGATQRIAEILETKPEVTSPNNPIGLPNRVSGRIEMHNVSFSYPSRPETRVLKDLSLVVKPGETVALVGSSGAGKTTLFQLLLRYYNVTTGTIRLDTHNIADCDPKVIRNQIAVVPQDTVIFANTAMENIRYGNPSASDEQVINAAKHAAADEFLSQQSEGYQTQLGERGVRLSGGQKQRIAIARAMLKNAPIILLDEATSALDAESERAVQQALAELTANKTTIVIAHRLATVIEADRIIVMDKGEIVGSGTHQELVTKGGLYARLAKLQFRDAKS